MSTEPSTTETQKMSVWAIVAILIFAGIVAFFLIRPFGANEELLTDNTILSSEMEEGNTTIMDTSTQTSEHIATFTTSQGVIEIELFADKAPETVANFEKLAREGFYNGTRFHRVISGFMIQGGDPLSKDVAQKNMWGTGGPGYTFADEINDEKLVQGVLAMANAGPGTNGSQFFIVTAEETPWLDGHHTAFGRVISGMERVLDIEAVPTDERDRPIEDVVVESVTLR